MDRVFSVEEISDLFWSPPPSPPPAPPSSSPSSLKANEGSSKINRSSSEWAFQRFLQEASVSEASPRRPPPPPPLPPSSASAGDKNDVVEIKVKENPERNRTSFNAHANNIPVDSEDYQAFLQSKLNLACAAVAMARDSAAWDDSGSQVSNPSQLGTQAPSGGAGYDLSRSQEKDAKGTNGIANLPIHKKSVVPLKQATSGSSREQSEDEEAEGETEMTANMDPADAKRVRRMLSNRESARRSRRRKQAHLDEIETQVAQLRVENVTLLKRLNDASQKHNEAAVDNRVLKADVETLRAKIRMAEEMVKRMTGLNPMFNGMSEISSISMQSLDRSPSDTSTDAAVPVQDEPNHHFYQSSNPNTIPPHDKKGINGSAEIP